MGQQQLLLLVLGIVIVGLAVVVGINAFSENRVKSNADALVTDGLRIASDIQAWALKPSQFGGGNDGDASTDDLSNCSDNSCFADIGYNTGAAANPYTNVNGEFNIGSAAVSSVGDTTCPDPDGTGTVTISASNADTENCVIIEIDGTNSNDIFTGVAYGS